MVNFSKVPMTVWTIFGVNAMSPVIRLYAHAGEVKK